MRRFQNRREWTPSVLLQLGCDWLVDNQREFKGQDWARFPPAITDTSEQVPGDQRESLTQHRPSPTHAWYMDGWTGMDATLI